MTEQIGYIYILSNKAFPNLLKIGFTYRTVNERIKELSSATGIPYKFKLVHSVETFSPDKKERMIHESLAKYRIKNKGKDKEFFEVTINEAKKVVDLIANPTKPPKPPVPTYIKQEQRLKRKQAVEFLLGVKYQHMKNQIREWIDQFNKNIELEKETIKEAQIYNKKRNRFGIVSRILHGPEWEHDSTIIEEYKKLLLGSKELHKKYTYDIFLKEHQSPQGIDDVLIRRDSEMLTECLGLEVICYNDSDIRPTDKCPIENYWKEYRYLITPGIKSIYKIFQNWDNFIIENTQENRMKFPGNLPLKGGLPIPLLFMDTPIGGFHEVHFSNYPDVYLLSDRGYYDYCTAKWLSEWWQKADPKGISPSNPCIKEL